MNTDLKREFYKISEAILLKLKENNIQPNYYFEQKRQFEENGVMSVKYEKVPEYSSVRRFCETMLKNLDISKFKKLLNQQHPYVNGSIGTRNGATGITPERLIEIMVVSVFSQNFTLDKLQFYLNKNLKDLSKLLTKKKTKRCLYALVANLVIDDYRQEIELEKGIILKKLTENEINRIVHDPLDLSIIRSSNNFALVTEYTDDIVFSALRRPNEPKIVKELQNKLNLIIYSLNLLKPNAIGISIRYIEQADFLSNFVGVSGMGRPDRIKVNEYKITSSEVSQWKAIYKKLSKHKWENFEPALHRLSEAELRRNPEDSIIDSIIGLEYILLNDIGNEELRGEMRFRFSVNFAILFKKKDRDNQRKLALDAYDLRSKIVHGGQLKTTSVKLAGAKTHIYDASQRIKEMLRYTLKYFIKLPKDKNFYTQGFWVEKLLKM